MTPRSTYRRRKAGRFATLESYDRATNSLTEPSGVLVFDYSKPPGAASAAAGARLDDEKMGKFFFPGPGGPGPFGPAKKEKE